MYWGTPRDVPPEYLDQLAGERKVEKRNKNTGRLKKRCGEVVTKGCHLRDCECIVLVCAILAGLMAGEPLVEEKEEPEQALAG